ncbi:MAG: hypothetical protein R2873_15990 [Caldilineaceae bacterium]
MDLSERRRVLAEMHYIRRQIDDTLERVLLDALNALGADPHRGPETIRRHSRRSGGSTGPGHPRSGVASRSPASSTIWRPSTPSSNCLR